MTTTMRRARLVGLVVGLVIFLAGGLMGAVAARRAEATGLRVTLTTTSELPRELDRLGLSPEQRTTIRALLRKGQGRVIAVLDEFDPRMRAAVDSTDQDIRGVLTATQRAAFDETRRTQPLLRQRRILRDSNGVERTAPR